MSENERMCKAILAAWVPAMAASRRKRDAVRLASDTGVLGPPCPHGQTFPSNCRPCRTEQRRVWRALQAKAV